MDISVVRVSVGVTINLGNFESLKIAYDAEAVLAPEDTPMESMDVLRYALTEKIRDDLSESAGGKKYLMKQPPVVDDSFS